MHVRRPRSPPSRGVLAGGAGPVSWLEAVRSPFPGGHLDRPSGLSSERWSRQAGSLLQWRGRAGLAPDFRKALLSISCARKVGRRALGRNAHREPAVGSRLSANGTANRGSRGNGGLRLAPVRPPRAGAQRLVIGNGSRDRQRDRSRARRERDRCREPNQFVVTGRRERRSPPGAIRVADQRRSAIGSFHRTGDGVDALHATIHRARQPPRAPAARAERRRPPYGNRRVRPSVVISKVGRNSSSCSSTPVGATLRAVTPLPGITSDGSA